MGWLLKHRKKDNKWRVWTTISDGWITDWLTESEMKEALAERDVFDSKLKVIETYMTFPAGWHDKDTHKAFDFILDVSKKSYYEWHLEVLALGHPGYEEAVEEKYRELTGKEEDEAT